MDEILFYERVLLFVIMIVVCVVVNKKDQLSVPCNAKISDAVIINSY